MACSRYEYVRKFQTYTQLLPDTFIMLRIDGKGFTKFCEKNKFKKPNDLRGINLMNQAASTVMEKFQQIFLAYGQSDEYSFVFSQSTQLFNRRQAKILSCAVSTFTAAYVMNWSKHFDTPMKQLPAFDGRCVCYPHLESLKDYFRWRQVDCHINNLYNTVFWCLVKQGKSNTQVQEMLKVTNSGDKNEILFRDFGINYNTIEQVYRKGSVICYYKKQNENQTKLQQQQQPINQQTQKVQTNGDNKVPVKQQVEQKEQQKEIKQQKQIKPQQSKSEFKQKKKNKKPKYKLQVLHIDIIKDVFWQKIRM